MSPPFAVQLPTQWKKLTGTGYGQRQPLLLGNLLGCAAGGWIGGFDAWMGEALSERLPADLGPDLSAQGVAQRLLHWTSVAQRWCGIPVFGMGQVLATNPARADEFLIALPYATPHAVPHAMAWVLAMMAATAAQGVPALEQDGAAQLAALVEGMRPFQVAVTNDYWFLAAAANAGIPVGTVYPGTFSYGQGRWARWMSSALTDATSHLGFRSTDKQLTATLLRRQGLPGAEHLLVASADEAAQAAARLGFPVVVKPADQSQGKGVSVFLRDEASVRRAFAEARALSGRTLVERHAPGRDLRLTVFQNQVVKVVERVPGSVLGDGRLTVAQLLERRLQDPDIQRRTRQMGRVPLALDEEALALIGEQGLTRDAVPAEGLRVLLRRRANTSTGGSVEFVPPARVHPDNLRLAINVAQALKLDFAGVDLLLPDAASSWLATGGMVCEVNAQPAVGSSNLLEAYAGMLHKLLGAQYRIPVIVLLGPIGETRPVMRALQAAGRAGLGGTQVVYASTDGLWEDGQQIAAAQPDAFGAAAAALAHPKAGAVVVSMSPDELCREGLPSDRCDAVLLLGQDAAGARRLPELWPLLLPHARHLIAMPGLAAGDVPPPAHLQQHGLSLQRPASPDLAWQQVRRLLAAR